MRRRRPRINLPQSHTLLGIVEALDSTEEIRQRVLRVPADEREEDPRSEERGLGAPALLRKVCPSRSAAGQQQDKQGGGEAGERVHCGTKLRNTTEANLGRGLVWDTTMEKLCLYFARSSPSEICAAATGLTTPQSCALKGRVVVLKGMDSRATLRWTQEALNVQWTFYFSKLIQKNTNAPKFQMSVDFQRHSFIGYFIKGWESEQRLFRTKTFTVYWYNCQISGLFYECMYV